MRIAGAPISWGVSEVPGWGHQLEPGRVLAEMRDLGLVATELGPQGFLPEEPGERAALLAAYDLELVGGFVPVVLHDPTYDPIPDVDRALDGLGGDDGGGLLVLAAATGLDGYDERPVLDTKGWATLLANLDMVAGRALARGHRTVLHPHVGTMVERREDVEMVLGGCGVQLCLDTGHLLVGGTDPLWLARTAARRIAHVHLKDVDAVLADWVREGRVTYTEAVGNDMYKPLGRGDIDITAIVRTLELAGYEGWYVMEQDTILRGEPDPGHGPRENVAASLAYLVEAAPRRP
ncbi:TIM barrel protein [Actinomadura barringtoniae]|uniref:TIM barrel protein n=1 Tax=Actinomadura barringtoniae TaxID=1427535 RepID=A0A939T6Z0_9ACTN|nr:TIM barrel protein [Actinomadura barringtoniae]MBO2455496.1 TIM barrel protein [Actinomadura barringtoniae]